jgi:6-phosphofructokinase 1
MEAVLETKKVAAAIESQNFDEAMGLRDTEFSEQYRSFMMTTAVQVNHKMQLPEKEVGVHIQTKPASPVLTRICSA